MKFEVPTYDRPLIGVRNFDKQVKLTIENVQSFRPSLD
jgi:hypothetical protein